MNDKVSSDRKDFFCFLSWGGFLVCVVVLLGEGYNAKSASFWLGALFMFLATLQLCLSIHYTRHYIRAILKKEHICVETNFCTDGVLLRSIVSLSWSTELHAYIARQLLEKLVSRMIQNPSGVSINDRVQILTSHAGDALSSTQADIILGGIKVEMLTREQIIGLLKRRTAVQRAEKWPGFLARLVQILLREELDRKDGWQLTAEDLNLLETLRASPYLFEPEQISLRLRFEVGVRPASSETIAGEVTEVADALLPSGKV